MHLENGSISPKRQGQFTISHQFFFSKSVKTVEKFAQMISFVEFIKDHPFKMYTQFSEKPTFHTSPLSPHPGA